MEFPLWLDRSKSTIKENFLLKKQKIHKIHKLQQQEATVSRTGTYELNGSCIKFNKRSKQKQSTRLQFSIQIFMNFLKVTKPKQNSTTSWSNIGTHLLFRQFLLASDYTRLKLIVSQDCSLQALAKYRPVPLDFLSKCKRRTKFMDGIDRPWCYVVRIVQIMFLTNWKQSWLTQPSIIAIIINILITYK